MLVVERVAQIIAMTIPTQMKKQPKNLVTLLQLIAVLAIAKKPSLLVALVVLQKRQVLALSKFWIRPQSP